LPFIHVMDELLKDPLAPRLTPANFFVPAWSPSENNLFSGHDFFHLNNFQFITGRDHWDSNGDYYCRLSVGAQ
jgi:hypothetical protein